MVCNLSSFITNNKKIPEQAIAYILREIVKGLNFIHSRHRIHRDLKCENIFIDQVGNIKIGDFGFSVQLTVERDERNTFAGSPFWIAPEILNNEPYGSSCDVWSLGIICFELAQGYPPNKGCQNLHELIRAVRTKPEPRLKENYSQPFREFVEACLQKDPTARKTSNELLEFEFVRNVDEESSKNYIIDRLN